MKRPPVESVTVLPYPSCEDGSDNDETEREISSGVLRSGATMREQGVVERWSLVQRGCLHVMRVRQDWALAVTDVEVVFDADYRPLRAWKRSGLPAGHDAARTPPVDTRLYELRNRPPTMTHVSGEVREHFSFRGGAPVAVNGPGRALIGAWLRANPDLAVGDIVRGPVLDFRRGVERVETVALRREADIDDASVADGAVRVYTVFGRESVFADAEGNILGDLAGLRPAARVQGELPPPREGLPEPDPRSAL